MPVHHDLAEGPGVIEEGTPDPNQIVFGLRRQRYARPHAGMDEEIVAEGDAEVQSPEKPEMRLGQRRRESLAPPLRMSARLRERRPAPFDREELQVVRSWVHSRPLEASSPAAALVPYPRMWSTKRGRYSKFQVPGMGAFGLIRARPTF